MKRLILFLLPLLALCACNSHTEITTDSLPTITFEQGDRYALKVGHTLMLSPRVENGESYAWIIDGVTVSSSATYTFEATRVGTFYVTLRVENKVGASCADIRIDVEALQLPVISFAVGEDRLLTLPYGEHTLTADVLYGEEAAYEWRLDNQIISTQPACTLTLSAAGDHDLLLSVENEDGRSSEQLTLRVVNRLDGEIHMADEYNVPLGRTLLLDATLWHYASPSYLWQCGAEQSTDPVFRFTPSTEGEYSIMLTITDSDGYSLTRTLKVVCTPTEGTFRREVSAESRATATKVYEYRPAAGQFINEPQSGFAGEQTADAAVAYAQKRLEGEKYVSLGGWGGYVVVGFDHSVVNSGDYDFSIAGNMHEGSSEAGIVWVMQDANGNGLPDDVWYELRGSEWGTENHSRGYAITYYRPAAAGMGVQWRDNRGVTGTLRRNATHTQEFYYPAWEESSFTLYGSRLEANTEVDPTTGNQVNRAYAWGYADNQGRDSDTGSAGEAVSSYFKISSAVAADGSAVDLQYIDFVKVQSAINFVAGALGEISTEVLRVEDENM